MLKKRLSLHYATSKVQVEEDAQMLFAEEHIGWLLSGRKRYTDVDWDRSGEETDAYWALVIVRAANLWNQVDLQIVFNGGAFYGQDDVGDVKKQLFDAKRHQQIKERLRELGIYVPSGENVVPAVQRCTIIVVR